MAFGAYYLFRSPFGGLFNCQRALPHGAHHCFSGSLAGQPGHWFSIDPITNCFGFGRYFWRGLGHSQQKLFYLPAAHTDFILSIIGEELGLVGTLSIIILFGLFIWQGTRIVRQTNNPFGYFLGMGIVMMLGLQAVVNVGVSIGAFPTKGLPLPFISYGGSALIFHLMAIALLLNISKTEDY